MRYLVNSSVPDHHMTSFKEATHLSLFRIYTDVIREIVQVHVFLEKQCLGLVMLIVTAGQGFQSV